MAVAVPLGIDTPHGLANVHLRPARRPRAGLILGHGAGGGVTSGDLVAVTDVALSEEVSVALVEQPYRVAGRRSPAPAHHLDVAWLAVVERLHDVELRGLPLIVGGRSLGARVACRTAAATGAVGVICLAFPLRPPRRAGARTATEPPGRARWGHASDARRSGRTGPIRDPTDGATKDSHTSPGHPQPEGSRRRGGGGTGLAARRCRSPGRSPQSQSPANPRARGT